MKLNNKGFAITAVLYGLLILFVILVSSYLLVLSVKKDRIDIIVNEIENDYINESANVGKNLLKHITNLYTDGNPTLITQGVTNDQYYYSYQDDTKTWGLMNDGLKVDNTLDATTTGLATTVTDTAALTSGTEGNIRYFGPSDKVNNYIYFNCSDYSNQSDSTCEKWRIMGIVDGKVKIISDSIGNIAWDDSSNNWDTASLKSMLNEGGTYYTSLQTKNPETLELISESTWYLGGYSNPSGLYPNDIYTYERTNKVGTTIYSGNLFTINANIGLMYTSDYGYGTDLTKCSQDIYNYESSANSYACRANNWLFNSAFEWLITPHSSNSSRAWNVLLAGSVYGAFSVYATNNGVRPVLYLKTNVLYVIGDGSLEKPYQLSM